ncbi:MAG: hypothetical protein B7Z15_05755 [Rhizobiales bacterium 32-66-8]|nr:MAG: hypothetical protein B7Z15_05755 [Rhizobiales bacterium 32-66-8]
MTADALLPAAPRRPQCASLAVLVREERLLLVRRANPPDAGLWGFPGGRIEWGETSAAAALRELQEETGLVAEAGPVLRTLDALDTAPDGSVRHHFLLVAVLCRWQAGEPVAADDALEAAWFDGVGLAARAATLSSCVAEVAQEALLRARTTWPADAAV